MKRRLDTAEVITAVAHKLARIYYSMLINGTPNNPELHQVDQEKARAKALKRLQRSAKALGAIIIDPAAGEVPGEPA